MADVIRNIFIVMHYRIFYRNGHFLRRYAITDASRSMTLSVFLEGYDCRHELILLGSIGNKVAEIKVPQGAEGVRVGVLTPEISCSTLSTSCPLWRSHCQTNWYQAEQVRVRVDGSKTRQIFSICNYLGLIAAQRGVRSRWLHVCLIYQIKGILVG